MCGIIKKQSGGWIDVLGSDSNEVLEHKFAATSSLLWRKRISSMLIQLAFNFDEKHVLDNSQEPNDGKSRKSRKCNQNVKGLNKNEQMEQIK